MFETIVGYFYKNFSNPYDKVWEIFNTVFNPCKRILDGFFFFN